MSKQLTAADFTPYIGKRCTPKGQHRVLTLVSIDTKRFPGWETLPREPFILLLSGPPGDVLQEGQYDVAIEDGPSVLLYIAPVHTVARDRQNYQVVFG
jgi:hypothetical protein